MKERVYMAVAVLALAIPFLMPNILSELTAGAASPTPANMVKPTETDLTRTPKSTQRAVIPTSTRMIKPTATGLATERPLTTATQVSLPPTPLPSPTPAFEATQGMNVRVGPGTNYAIMGYIEVGERLPVLGTNADKSWFQVNYHGQPGWVVSTLGEGKGPVNFVGVAQNIPPTPRPTATPAPTATPEPVATAVPTATAVPSPTPKPWDGYTRAIVVDCYAQPEGTFFQGYVRKDGKPVSDVRVVFSDTPGGGWSSAPVLTGPRQGYEDWKPGFYRHTIGTPPEHIDGNWYVWLVDEKGDRISAYAGWHSTGHDGCNEAIINFEK